MRSTSVLAPLLLAGSLAVVLGDPGRATAQQILQDGFETREPTWVPRGHDAAHKVLAHQRTDQTAHGGQRCEHIQIQAEKGSYIHFSYDVGRAPINEDLVVSLWLKSDRPNVQLFCRVVLPNEADPDHVGQKMTVLVRCEPYQRTRWKMISLRQPVKRLQEQQQLLRAQHGRDIITTGAYVDRLVLNVYDGPGQTNVWIDDLEVGPVLDAPARVAPAQPSASTGAVPGTAPGRPAANMGRRAAEVQLRDGQLLVSGRRFLLRGIRYSGTPLDTLRDAGFNTVWVDEDVDPKLVDRAVNLGFWLVPTVHPPDEVAQGGGRVKGQLTSRETFANRVRQFLAQDAVLCWDLGSNLGVESYPQVARTARAFRDADPMRPLSADVWEGVPGYSRGVDQLLLGTHRWPLCTSLELGGYREWLLARRRLASPDTFCWTWIQTHLPDWFLPLGHPQASVRSASFRFRPSPLPEAERGGRKYQARGTSQDTPLSPGRSVARTAIEPMGPQPEQIRLLTYLALSAGYRGLGFWSDRSLADSQTGRDRLLALALLNQELKLIEPIILQAGTEPEWHGTSRPEVMCAVIRTSRAVLALPIWVGKGSQLVPGQGSTPQLVITVPQVPITSQAWEVSPGRIRSYPIERVLGGAQVKLHNFSLTAAVVFTSDLGPTGLVVRLQDQQRRMAKLAAQWLHDQAQEELAKVEQVNEALEKAGHALPDAAALLKRAREALERCTRNRQNAELAEAYSDAEVCLRALRVLMRAHWDTAVKDLDTPVASPYAVSFFSLPRHWLLLDELKRLKPGTNVLTDGDFERPPQELTPGWSARQVPSLDGVTYRFARVADNPHQGKQCLLLQVQPKSPARPVAVLERSLVAIQSPEVRLPPGTLVRISAWVRLPSNLGGSPDGALIYDSSGGEPLAVRRHDNTKNRWKRYTLFRRVPESGTISVTLALAGLGTAYFDDVKIEPLQ
jgi:hypothetical protein